MFSICESVDENIWIGTFNGVVLYNRARNKFRCISPEDLTGGSNVKAIIQDKQRHLWIATEDSGLTKMISRNNEDLLNATHFEYKRYKHISGSENCLLNNRIHSLAEDKYGMIWLASNLGLSRFDPQKGRFKHFTLKNRPYKRPYNVSCIRW